MGMTSAERMKLHRDRKRLGLRPVQVLVSEQDIDYLLAKDYELNPTAIARSARRYPLF